MAVQQPLELFEQSYGPFDQLAEKKKDEQKSEEFKKN